MSGVPTRMQALKIARQLGCTVETVKRTGEVRITSPDGKVRVTMSNRRTDASRALLDLIRKAR